MKKKKYKDKGGEKRVGQAPRVSRQHGKRRHVSKNTVTKQRVHDSANRKGLL